MADRTIKPDDTNDLVLQNNDGSAKLELNEDQTVKVTTGSDAGEDFSVNTSSLVVTGDDSNVGIGTNAPLSTMKLHVKSTASSGSGHRGIRVENTSASGFAEQHFKSDTREYRIGTGGSSTSDSGDLYFYDATGTATRLNIDSSGSITTPNGQFNGTIGSSANLGSAVFPSGHIIQTENIATTSTFTPGSISTGTFVDSGFSDTITPKRTDSKLLVNFCGTVSSSSDVWIYIALQFSGSSITTQTVGESGTNPLVRTNPRGTGINALWTSSFTVLKDVNQSNTTDVITVKIRLGVVSTSTVTLGERQSAGEELMTTMTIQEVMP